MKKGKKKTHILLSGLQIPLFSFHNYLNIVDAFLLRKSANNCRKNVLASLPIPKAIVIMYISLVFILLYCCKTPQYCRTALFDGGPLLNPQQRDPLGYQGRAFEPETYFISRQADKPLSYVPPPAPSGTLQFESLEVYHRERI